MEDDGNSVTVDIESLATSIENMMGDNLYMPSECCIFKTPAILFRHNEKAYVPNAFSIGPFHHGKPNLIPTQKIKLKYLHGLLRRATCPERQLRELIKSIKEIEGKARKCYAGPIGCFNEKELVKILVLDGCFIIELFRKDDKVVERDHDDPIFTMSCLLQFLSHDLILLENQIPWFVLELLFNKTKDANSKPLDQLTIQFFGNMFSSNQPSMELLQQTKFPTHKSNHILDLLRNLLILSSEERKCNHTSGSSNQNLGWQPFPTATTLKEAGIKFFIRSSNSILDITFRDGDGCLEIPSLLIQETTETIFRNLISFEQCIPNYPPRITSYARLMVNLIDTSKDMEILCKKGIVDNWLNCDEATQLFNKLYNDAYMKEFHYLNLCNQVNRFCKLRCPRWHYNLRHNYFNTPWATVGVVAGGLILLFTIIQTVCSVIQTVNPMLCIMYKKHCD